MTGTTPRQRLPDRRQCHTEELEVGGQAFAATVGFDPEDNSPRKLFLTAGKEGSLLNALLAKELIEPSIQSIKHAQWGPDWPG